MTPSIGLAFNIFNDNLALPGLLESASGYFDDIVAIHAGPSETRSTDGTIETLERWGVRTVFSSIDIGFGKVRTQCLRESKAEWVMILDADERFHRFAPIIDCFGTDRYPAIANPNLEVKIVEAAFNQGQYLKRIISNDAGDADAIRTCRRHWFDFSWTKPCENWQTIYDWQLRLLRNRPHVGFDPSVRMHEHAMHGGENKPLSYWSGDPQRGPFHDHYHCFFKVKEPAQRLHDIAIYDAIHEGRKPPTEAEFKKLNGK